MSIVLIGIIISQKKRPKYITSDIIAMSRDRDYHHKLAAQAPPNSELANYHYKLATSLRKSVNFCIKNSKHTYIF